MCKMEICGSSNVVEFKWLKEMNMNRTVKEVYQTPMVEEWKVGIELNLLKTLSTDLYLEGDIDGYEDIDEY